MEPVYRSVIGTLLGIFRAQKWDIRVSGTEHVPRTGGAIIATNHVGYLDFTFVGYGVRQAPGKRLVRFAAKKETFDHPVSGPLMRAMKHIPVDRAGAASATLVRIENEAPATYRFEVRYLFDFPEAFADYEAGPAIALRQEGVALFGPESEHPMRFSRIIGTVVSEHARED